MSYPYPYQCLRCGTRIGAGAVLCGACIAFEEEKADRVHRVNARVLQSVRTWIAAGAPAWTPEDVEPIEESELGVSAHG